MAKGISGQVIVDTALTLIDNGGRPVNFRDIARELNCAHTNLYNYFDSFYALLWEARQEIMRRLQASINDSLRQAVYGIPNAFFGAIIDFYLAHTGWFSLAWFEPLGSPRPKAHFVSTVSMVDGMVEVLSTEFPDADPYIIRMSLHNVNAYILGELSIYIAGRGLIREELPFRAYVTEQAAHMMRLLVQDKEK